jgi:hypothetical protein
VIFEIAQPEHIAGEGKLDNGTMLSAVGLIDAKTSALDPVQMSFRVAGSEQVLSLV